MRLDDSVFVPRALLRLTCYCGASADQKAVGAAQSNFFTQATNTAQQVLGAASSVFKNLMSTFSPIVAAGPSQKGFSLAQESDLRSQAITQTGVAYKNARAATGEAEASQNGGNVVLPGGANIGRDVALANSAAAQTSGELSQIEEADYAQGNKNYEEAVSGMEAAPNVYGTAVSAENAATGAGKAASDTQNQITADNQSWMQAVSGALGGITGDVVTGGMSNLGKGVGFFG